MTTYTTSRDIPALPEQVFAAMCNPVRLARWWGPDGFSNTFSECDLRPGGRWVLVMHGPDGHQYPNEAVFEEIEAPCRFVVHHVSQPRYRLTVTLTVTPTGCVVAWQQAFEDERIGARLAPIVVPANEQNLARLAAEVLGGLTA
ncbi:SRPBCC domain-containing protein [Silvimonas amylolytica]|uniref:Activator of Hsp90 ATPase homologue 1/2-like C-terminal domain-containing protein n=1 Tax=Silvimonas amylolytica TaxID=449663 RepID=A0ABQ2PGB0_9NEIS|nr:SRPBCC domain-containing protein [Silvimonas amylolytica]GGP24416.1 hypothetical protein GCM10010971_02350 [Silvimonas amylolytica]